MNAIATPFQEGDKIEYMLPDKAGKPHWFKGAIHGVKRTEDPKTNMILNITYLVDTGRDVYKHETPFNYRDREISRRIDAEVAKGKSNEKALTTVLKQDDLPESKIGTEVFRQPEQIELPAEHIRTV